VIGCPRLEIKGSSNEYLCTCLLLSSSTPSLLLRVATYKTPTRSMTNGSPIRQNLSPPKRALPLEHTIDPGFVNRRAVQSVLGPAGMRVVDEITSRLPPLPEWQASIRLDHIYTDVMLEFCSANEIPTLAKLLRTGAGSLFCSTEHLLPNDAVYEAERTTSEIQQVGSNEARVLLEYSTKHIHADTTRMELNTGALQSIIARFTRKEGNSLYFKPLVMGAPWLRSEDPTWADEIIWWAHDFFEHFVRRLSGKKSARGAELSAT
jgi:hypothetical protein